MNKSKDEESGEYQPLISSINTSKASSGFSVLKPSIAIVCMAVLLLLGSIMKYYPSTLYSMTNMQSGFGNISNNFKSFLIFIILYALYKSRF